MAKQEGTTIEFVYDLPELELSEERIRLTVPEGETGTFSFSVSASDGSRIHGLAISDEPRIQLDSADFEGENCRISGIVDLTGWMPGESFEGLVSVISCLGEKTVSVCAEISAQGQDSFDPEVQTLEDFAKVCQKSLREGFRLFTNPEFSRILNGKNRPYTAFYKGMSHNPVTYQHLEEFLVSTGKKEPVVLSLDKQEKGVFHLEASQKDTLYLYRSTWGYVRIEVEAECDFLEVEKKTITTEDFIGRVYGLEYIVHADKIGEGRQFGKIVLRSVHQTLEYQVEVSRHGEAQIRPDAVRNRRISWLLRDYLGLLLHRLDYHTWQESAAMTVHDMREADPEDSLAVLYAAYLDLSREDNTGVLENLWPVKDGKIRLKNREERAIYLSLAKAAGLLPAEKSDITGTLQRYLERQPDSYVILHLLQKEIHAEEFSRADQLAQLEACFNAGCTSPFLYLEAWNILKQEESLLRRLSPFMLQVLCFAQRYQMLTEGLLLRTAFLSGNSKHFSAPVTRILTSGYEKYPSPDVLEAICKQLIKGDPLRKECFPWFARAVDAEIRITRLYEYYMETFDKPASVSLPLPVLMYFATNNTLGEKKRARLYASVILHREEDFTSYENYSRNMKEFAEVSLARGRINRDYAVLYREFFRMPDSREQAEQLVDVMFARRLTTSDRRIRQVVVIHNALREEQCYPCRDGVAYPRIYSEDACILLEDDRHRRFGTTVRYSAESLMDERESARQCLSMGAENAGLELYLCREKAFQMDVNSASVEDYRKAVQNEAFTDEYRNIIRRKLVEFYLHHPTEDSRAAVPQKEVEAYASADKAGTVSILIRDGRYPDAFRIVEKYGAESIPADQLLKLTSRLILQNDFEENPVLVSLAWKVFSKDKYDDVILIYLRDHYDGPIRNLCRLWKRAEGFQLDTYTLEERILLRSMASRQFPECGEEILGAYIRQQGSRRVIQAFLTFLASWYFLGGRKTPELVFSGIEQQILQGEQLDVVCRLALLRHYSELCAENMADAPDKEKESPEDTVGSATDADGTAERAEDMPDTGNMAVEKKDPLTETQEEIAEKLLREMDESGMRFEFFSRLPQKLIQVYQIEDKVFVEEQFRPDSRVILHYRLQEQNGGDSGWISEPMRNVYRGIFVREFLLFYGETLTYYLSILEHGEIRKTDSYQVSLVGMDTGGITRYKLLNHMLEARAEGNQAELIRTLRQYQSQDVYVRKLLPLME